MNTVRDTTHQTGPDQAPDMDHPSQRIDAQLSEFVDGELEAGPARFLLQRLGHDASLRGRFARHHLARACLRRERHALLPGDFAARVSAALASEPVLRRGFGSTARWVGGAAVAASVALMALIAARPVGDPALDPTSAPAVVSTGALIEAPLREQDLRPDYSRIPAQTVAATQSREIGSELPGDNRLEPYLVRHNQALQAQGRASFVPYVQLVAPPVEGTVRALGTDGAR